MYTWAVLAAKEAAVPSGLGAGIVPAVGAGSLDGFAIGALVSGTCIFMLTSPRHGRRRGPDLAGRGRGPDSAGSRRSVASAARGRDSESVARGRVLAAAHGSDTDGTDDEPQIAGEAQVPAETGQATGERQDLSGNGGYRSRHRLPDQNESPKRPGPRRSTPRHAAPSASFSARMTGRIGFRALASGVRS
jgi:hypothetical protein